MDASRAHFIGQDKVNLNKEKAQEKK
jgi:hypothetical protein